VAGALANVFRRLGLRFPTLFVILLTVTLADLVVPDIIPFVDEIVLAALTALFGLWRERREPGGPSRDTDPTRAA
jgi:Family of unknown function (DUF6116)